MTDALTRAMEELEGRLTRSFEERLRQFGASDEQRLRQFGASDEMDSLHIARPRRAEPETYTFGEEWAPGDIKVLAGTNTPAGRWLLCDGAAVSRTTYAALFAAIGTAWGVGDGSTTFNLPPEGIFMVNKTAGDVTFDTVGKTGGSKTHSHDDHADHSHAIGTHIHDLSNHTHDVDPGTVTGNDGSGSGWSAGSTGLKTSTGPNPDATGQASGTTGSVTGGEELVHSTESNLPPFGVFKMYIRF